MRGCDEHLELWHVSGAPPHASGLQWLRARFEQPPPRSYEFFPLYWRHYEGGEKVPVENLPPEDQELLAAHAVQLLKLQEGAFATQKKDELVMRFWADFTTFCSKEGRRILRPQAVGSYKPLDFSELVSLARAGGPV